MISRLLLRVISIVGLVFALGVHLSSFAIAEDIVINLDSTTPYIDVPVTITEPVNATINTVNGTHQTNPAFIDSWIEVWQGVNKLRADDDGLHSATNVLASIITMPLTVGEYFIRATSFAYMCCNQAPAGSYLLQTNLIISSPTPTPTPTLEPSPSIEPSPTPTETVTPTPTPEPTPTETSSPTPTPTIEPTPTETPTQQPDPVEDNEPNEAVVVPSISPEPEILEEVIQEEESIEQLLPEETIETPIEEIQTDEENVTPVEENVGLLDSTEIVLAVFGDAVAQTFEFASEIAGEVFAIADESVGAFLNIGDDMSPEVREEAQSVVVSAIIITQIASSVSIGTAMRSTGVRIK
jgi:hypothetical protein